MMHLEVTHNGKKYKSISDAIHQDIIDGIKEEFESSLKPFKSEILKHGGRVKVDVDKDFKDVKIHFIDLPEELIERISNSI